MLYLKDNMNIGIDGNEANVNKKVGSNIYAFQLIKYFKILDKKNEFIVYLKKKPLGDLSIKKHNWSYKILQPKQLWSRFRLPIELYLSSQKLNIFFSPGHYAPKYCPVPLVISIMDLSFLHYPNMFRKKDLYKLINWTKDSVKRADHIFTISEFTKKDIITNYRITGDKITVTYPGLNNEFKDSNISPKTIEKVKSKFCIMGKYILYLGTIQPRKNLIKLIKAFKEIDEQNLQLVITGKKGWHYQEIISKGLKSGSNNHVIFTGYVKDKDKIALLKGASCLALVSLYEGFGIPVIEAMAVGVPTVVSNTSSLPEIAGKTGILVDPENVKSISRGLSQAIQLNESQRYNIAVKNREIIKKFNWKKTSEKTLEVIYEIAV